MALPEFVKRASILVLRPGHVRGLLREPLGNKLRELFRVFPIGHQRSREVELTDRSIVAQQKDASLREVIFLLPEVTNRQRGLTEIPSLGGPGREAQFARSGVHAVVTEHHTGLLQSDRARIRPRPRLRVRSPIAH